MRPVHVLVAVVSALVVGSVTVAAPRIDIPGITRVRDEGTPVAYRPNLNFTGAGVTCTDDAVNNETDCAISGGGGGGYDQIQDEGTNLTQRTTLDFVGAGVTCTDTGAKTQCSIPGGGGGSGNGVELSVDLGTGGAGGLIYAATVTGQTWVTATSIIVCNPFATTADGKTVEEIVASDLRAVVSTRVAGVGFTLNVFNPYGARGIVRFHCIGV
jgi:hypothetical protein